MSMTSPFLSVIVPVYNTQKYLRNCIDSILRQTFQNFELILVDDGSKDDSGIICDQYADLDSRVRVYHKSNGGVTSARKFGVNHVADRKNHWITFVDSDDSLPEDAFESLVQASQEADCDIVYGRIDTLSYPFSELHPSLFCAYLISRKYFDVAPFAKLFRKELFGDFIFDIPRNIYVGEDFLMNIRLGFTTTKPIRFINRCVYNYVIREEGCISNFKSSLEYDAAFFPHLLASIPAEQRDHFWPNVIECCLHNLLFVARTSKSNTWKKTEYFQTLMTEAKRVHYPLSLKTKALLYWENRLPIRFYHQLCTCLQK